ncbi:MAG: DHA2 family efflux MFS transporter permease subunit [Deltaproteobacteria bacterium]|nr:DHA2 family efflux MFS transporter permease subunit [Deltaproteobacteria bacterium]
MEKTDAGNYTEEWRPGSNPWLIAVAIMLATTLEVLDTSVANVAVPHIAGTLSATPQEGTWVLTSYIVSNAIVLPASAWFGSLWGRKRVLLISIALFTLSSMLCGVAASLGQLVLFRVLQGVGGGSLQPFSQAILMESFPKEKRTTAMAVFGIGVIAAPIVGPILGGWITDNFSWRWIFFINLPFGIAAFLMIKMFVEDPPYIRKIGRGIDYYGFALMAIGLGTLQVILDKGQQVDWFQAVWLRWTAVGAFVSLFAFVFWEFRTKHPVVDLYVLKDRNLVGGMIVAFMIGAIMYGTMALLPLFYQTMMQYTALLSGFILLPLVTGALLGTIVVAVSNKYIDNRVLMLFGLLLIGSASFMLGNINLQVAMNSMVIPLFVLGVGTITVFIPLSITALGTLAARDMGNGSGLFNLARNIGGSFGIAITTTMLARMAQLHQTVLVGQLTPFNPLYQRAIRAYPSIANGMLYGELLRQSALLAYVDCFRWYSVLAFLCITMIFLFRKVESTGPMMVH